MAKRIVNLGEGSPFLDIVSFGRGWAGRRLALTRGQIDEVRRTVRRAPEVVIKVLPKGSNSAKSVENHIGYIGRRGNLELETDDGVTLRGKGVGEELLKDWDLDLETHRRESEIAKTRGRVAPKLVHKVLFSMPPGTPPTSVLSAVQNLAREEFALKHRYAMVLHTDEPHPHVHLVIKAVSEQGVRLNIRKATLRVWRARFAHQLRKVGIAANATDRFVRGQANTHKLDGVYRPMHDPKRSSTHMQRKVESVTAEIIHGNFTAGPSKPTLVETRAGVERGWQAVIDILDTQREPALADEARRFLRELPPPRTEQELIAAGVLKQLQKARVPSNVPPGR